MATIVPILENMMAPELYASEASFFSTSANAVTITFTSLRYDHSSGTPVAKRVVVGRVVLPSVGAQGLAVGLYDYLKKHGLDPVPVPGDPKQIQ